MSKHLSTFFSFILSFVLTTQSIVYAGEEGEIKTPNFLKSIVDDYNKNLTAEAIVAKFSKQDTKLGQEMHTFLEQQKITALPPIKYNDGEMMFSWGGVETYFSVEKIDIDSVTFKINGLDIKILHTESSPGILFEKLKNQFPESKSSVMRLFDFLIPNAAANPLFILILAAIIVFAAFAERAIVGITCGTSDLFAPRLMSFHQMLCPVNYVSVSPTVLAQINKMKSDELAKFNTNANFLLEKASTIYSDHCTKPPTGICAATETRKQQLQEFCNTIKNVRTCITDYHAFGIKTEITKMGEVTTPDNSVFGDDNKREPKNVERYPRDDGEIPRTKKK
ncbi:MAG: hypothetical protein A2504_07350 [Bdellovibrionales bacterium RIFOXYD12_FULL_39_22]|nr:MAG: hypothetical protein A2385_16720 [Bdellovibrionales bacterium RIFOXYB1_FULL_39_21]OFZ44693.1 MAG: hypothetical protein A2485_14580 [Bdellovibrionales bacterium RIFOXYC12_FULL_39_17]OFZ49323.1 MAG: hypothetical protein A2404_08875 [Bdellovibrionales bacterium RIFOXYC1_FULL_39_130]OFZ77059.1 MAG: hypothetical protein A2560_09840 [Bdellovibrionales bacterium RIFOXYD1_FULL_39_84]OFZ95319.1 MAG: hypothetical protein A2504_07350 [Bdellovibrionales bacterium RIFOXYD12_FULL_39_22]HLE13064.1 hy